MNTWHFEWELLLRKRAFRLVHVPFLLARYITIAALLFLYVPPTHMSWVALVLIYICAASVVSGRVKVRIACDRAYPSALYRV